MEDSASPAAAWDLSDLYQAPNDPRIAQGWLNASAQAEAFQSRYRAIDIGALDPPDFLQALRDYERIQEEGIRPLLYASLLFSEDTQNAEHKALFQKAKEQWVALESALLFFRLALIQLPESRLQALLEYPPLETYRHPLQLLRRFRSFTRPEKEEEILQKKNMTGRSAFIHLFDEFTGSFIFRLEVEGQEREFTGSQILAFLHSPHRELRERAFRLFLDHHGRNQLVLTSIFNSLIHDAQVEDDLRGYRGPMDQTLLENMIPAETVEIMMGVTEAHYPLAQKYWELKARLLGLPRLKNSDLYAPLPGAQQEIDYDRAQDLLLRAFSNFHPEFGRIARQFFDQRWIDAAIRKGKYGGAFCAGMTPSLHPYLLLNFTGNLRDLMTLAHEMGHGVHFFMARKQTWMNFDPPLPLAETASVFGEMVMIQTLLEEEKDPSIRRSLLALEIDDILATVFRQNVLTRFEQEAYRLRRDHLLSPEEIGDLWQRVNRQLFGHAVEMLPEYRWGWSYISHFIHSRFYCFSYIFGELVVLALYSRYLSEGPSFLPRFIQLLESGGSGTPVELLGRMGIEIQRPDLWEMGLGMLRHLIDELQRLSPFGDTSGGIPPADSPDLSNPAGRLGPSGGGSSIFN